MHWVVADEIPCLPTPLLDVGYDSLTHEYEDLTQESKGLTHG